jgi:hypothetical protein
MSIISSVPALASDSCDRRRLAAMEAINLGRYLVPHGTPDQIVGTQQPAHGVKSSGSPPGSFNCEGITRTATLDAMRKVKSARMSTASNCTGLWEKRDMACSTWNGVQAYHRGVL